MNRDEKIAAIRAKCVEANPDIVKLQAGCEFKVRDPHWSLNDGRYVIVGESVCGNLWHTHAFDKGEQDNRLCYWSKEHMPEIDVIGRPIRLTDVLWAVSQSVRHNLRDDCDPPEQECTEPWSLTDRIVDEWKLLSESVNLCTFVQIG